MRSFKTRVLSTCPGDRTDTGITIVLDPVRIVDYVTTGQYDAKWVRVQQSLPGYLGQTLNRPQLRATDLGRLFARIIE